MQRKTKIGVTMLLGITTLMLMTGCSKNNENIINIGDQQYLKKDSGYTLIQQETRTFLPGQHTVYYQVNVDGEKYRDNKTGWANAKIFFPEAPDGYEYVDSMVIDRAGHGSTSNIIYVFKNTVPVEATTSYNEITGEIGFYEPGTPVKEMILEP